MKPIDWTLLVIARGGSQPLQPVQLQKSLFLIAQNLAPDKRQTDSFYEFIPYDYGPFCSAVYMDVDLLEAQGLVGTRRPPETRYKTFAATDAGMLQVAKLEAALDPQARDYLVRVVHFTQSLSFNALVSVIYKAYPEMRANSVFQG